MSWWFLAVAACCFLLAINTVRPVRRPGGLAVLSFFAGWLVGELALHHVGAQLVIAGGFVAAGALAAWPGWLALALCAVAWAVLLRQYRAAARTARTVEAALRDGLGDDYDDAIPPETLARLAGLSDRPDWGAILAPLPIRHPEVECVADIVYHKHERLHLRLDVYRHRSRPTRTPTFLFVHGGAWMIGRKDEQGLPLLHHLAALGWTCFTINYRLSPRATFPDHLVDVKRAIAWIRAHGAEWGADPDVIVIGGGSAGGHLASLAALTPGDKTYQPGFEHADTSVAGCVSFYGVYDFADRHRCYPYRGFAELIERHVLKVKLDEARDLFDRASPIACITPDAPPFLVLHGTHDTLVPVAQARHFAEAFRGAARAPLALAILDGAQHAFEVFPSLRSELAVRGVARFCAWVAARHQTRREAGATVASA